MEKMRVVIIDDDESAIDNLCFLLKSYPQMVVEGIARNGLSAMKLIEKIRPDVLFLDIELPDMLGLDLISRMRERILWNMQIVFYTAYNKYMIDALRNYAFDFLLKPVDRKELEIILSRLEVSNNGREDKPLLSSLCMESECPFMLTTPTGDLRIVRASDIGYFRYQSSRKIWEVALSNGTFLPLKRNTSAEQLCAYNDAFVQVHQSFIINMNYLLMVQDNRCIMYPPFNNIGELTVSKKYKKEMMDRFYHL